MDFPFLRLILEQAGHGLEQRRLARAVGAEDGEDFAFPYLQGHTEQGIDPVEVERLDAGDLQQSAHSPRYALITSGWRCTSAGVPSASLTPGSSATMRSARREAMRRSCSTSR